MKINLTSILAKYFGSDYIEVDLKEPKPIFEVIYDIGRYKPEFISTLFNDNKMLWDGIVIILDGNIEKNLAKEVKNDSELTILLPAAGG